MAKKIPGRDKAVIPQSFMIPDGLEDFTYEEEFIDESLDPNALDSGEEDTDEIEPVFSIRIVSQTIRKTKKGLHPVVDVVVEVDDTTGADNYELRVTKA